MPRREKCGHATTMYTYPAWTFGGKHKGDTASPGPGPGHFVPASTFSGAGPKYGARSASAGRGPQPHGPVNPSGTGYLKPGYLTAERKGPSFSFGNRLPGKDQAGPGPLSYDIFPAGAQTMSMHPTPSWGPPPRPRPASAPRAPPLAPSPAPQRTKGPSFGTSRRDAHLDKGPGPQSYNPCYCASGPCCVACDGYKGSTFGMRPPMMYGATARFGKTVRADNTGPSAAEYHVDCSTIGAATTNCAQGSSTYRRS